LVAHIKKEKLNVGIYIEPYPTFVDRAQSAESVIPG